MATVPFLFSPSSSLSSMYREHTAAHNIRHVPIVREKWLQARTREGNRMAAGRGVWLSLWVLCFDTAVKDFVLGSTTRGAG